MRIRGPLFVGLADLAALASQLLDRRGIDLGLGRAAGLAACLLPLLGAPRLEAQTYVTGPINTDTTWTIAGSPYVVQGSVSVTATLTVLPGVIVKLDINARLNLSGLARLLAPGTALQPIYFTSLKDDTVGGDTNGDKPSTHRLEQNRPDWLGRLQLRLRHDPLRGLRDRRRPPDCRRHGEQ